MSTTDHHEIIPGVDNRIPSIYIMHSENGGYLNSILQIAPQYAAGFAKMLLKARDIALANSEANPTPEKKEARPDVAKHTLPARRETRFAVAPDGSVLIEQDTEDGDVMQLVIPMDDEDAFAARWQAAFKEAKALRTAAEPKGPQPLAPKLNRRTNER